MAGLASIYSGQERWEDAEKLQMHVYQTRRRVFGEEHPDTLASAANLASIRSIAGGDRDEESTRLIRE